MPTTTEAFDALLARHRGIVFKVVNSYRRRPEDRDDLAQDIAVQLWRAWPSYDPSRSFSTWMYRIALNVALSSLRRRGDDEVAFDDTLHAVADDAARDPEHEDQVRALHRFIAAQPPLDRALLLLYLDERPQREIAEILGISETNVSTKIGRLKRRIRDEL